MADEVIDISNLSEKHQTFCREYLVDLIGTQAAIRAGYAPDSANVTASKLLTNTNIRAYIQALMKERSENTLVDAVFVVENLKEVAARCMQAKPVMIFNPIEKKMEQKQDAAGNGVWEFDSNGANKALELMGKHVAMVTDKTDNNNRTNLSVTRSAKEAKEISSALDETC